MTWLKNLMQLLKNILKDFENLITEDKIDSNEFVDNLKLQPLCQYQCQSNECDLIKQLKTKQSEKDAIGQKILNDHVNPIMEMPEFIKLLMIIKEEELLSRLFDYRCRLQSEAYDPIYMRYIFDRTFHDIKIDTICNELENYNQREDYMENLKVMSSQLDKEIADIKSKLGIS